MKTIVRLLLFVGIVVCSSSFAQAQTISPLSLLAYQCQYVADTQSVQIDFTLLQNGTPAPDVAIKVTHAGDNVAITGADALAPTAQSTPIQLTLVLDRTETFPLPQIQDGLGRGLTSPGLPEALAGKLQIRLVGFGQAPGTPSSYVDNNFGGFVNDVVDALAIEPGLNNSLYDTLGQAAANFGASDLDPALRHVIIVITDSRRKTVNNTQENSPDIITAARTSKQQIFAIGLDTSRDAPDKADLSQIAQATGGYAWVYQGHDTSPATLGTQFSTLWGSFLTSLDSDEQVTIPVSALQPDISGGQQVTLNLHPASASDATSDSQISCPLKGNLNYTANFVNLSSSDLITDARDVTVDVEPQTDPNHLTVTFLLNGNSVQSGHSLTYHLDPAVLTEPSYTLVAQVTDDQGQGPVQTALVPFSVQRRLQLQATNADGSTTNLNGAVTFKVSGGPADLAGKTVNLFWSDPNANVPYPLSATFPALGSDGTASLTVNDIRGEYNKDFPNGTGTVVAQAYIEGAANLRIAVSQPLQITFAAAPAAAAALNLPSMPLVAGGISLVLLLVQIILWRQVRLQRLRRMIAYPDNHELPESPTYYITVSHKGDTQTYSLTKKTNEIGRGDSNDIPLNADNEISRQHGAILWRRRRWYYANRKSKVRCHVNGKPIKGLKVVPLKDMTQIDIGEYVLIFHANELNRDAAEFISTII